MRERGPPLRFLPLDRFGDCKEGNIVRWLFSPQGLPDDDDNGDDKFKHRTVGTQKGTNGVSGRVERPQLPSETRRDV